ncbi:S-adenosyl-L-methionine-dependent methyltransferase [Catenaria anguillulae PL171]|uniref:type I protein arginine methyltransferase n=1 Tax=Catenaria anguillulae PL171 TaxID=765915 RepID=A0A1Y2H4B0_9FUNG|nr:S-adenosyl-L-methionine-dependent methyltransferase [Catenaria anguillulae PL171]
MPVPDKTAADYYFNSYAHFGIHEEMLKDAVRTESYRKAIVQNKHLFRNKVVLDVGCGTGILSMFAAQSGAKLVIGVDMSDIIHTARKIVKANGFEGKVTLLQGKMEEVVLPVDKVDIIISEWMGYFLLYESMLDTVLYARDRYLNEGGMIFPDRTTIHIAALEDGDYKDSKIGFWDNVYGFDYSVIKPWALREPLVDIVNPSAIVSSSATVLDIDLNKVTVEDLAFASDFQLTIKQNTFVHGFVAWFDTWFNAAHKPVYFSTGAHAEPTHWKQTVFYTKDDAAVRERDVIVGHLKCGPNAKNHRDLDIDIEWSLKRGEQVIMSEAQQYHMC